MYEVNKAREILLNQDDAFLKLSVKLIKTLKLDKTIIFDSFQNYARLTGLKAEDFVKIDKNNTVCFNGFEEGCTIVKGDIHIILTYEQAMPALHYPENRAGSYGNHNSYNLDNASDVADRISKRRVWTIAHEIGHIMLGHIKDTSKEEREANKFAAELLMPHPVVDGVLTRLYKSGKIPDPKTAANKQSCNDIIAGEVAAAFGVSKTAARIRLKELSVTKHSSHLWDELLAKYDDVLNRYVKSRRTKTSKSVIVCC